MAEEGLDAWRGPPLIERLLTVLEVQLPNVTARLPAMAVADALNEIVRFAHKRVYLLIHNFPADNAMVQGWDAVKRLCRNCLHSTNLVVSDGRNPRCWAGQTALTREQRADWALRCKRYDESQVTCADYPGNAIGKCTTLGQYAALVERSVPPGGANTFRNHSSESDEDNDAEHDDDDDDNERVDSKDDSDDDHDDNETPGAKFAKLRQKLARPDPYALIQETASVVHKRSVVPGVEQTFSLFDYSIRQHCEPYFRQHDVQLYDRAFTVPGFAPGHPAFPNLYLHPAGSMSGIHRDADHSYFYLRLLRGRKVARAWAMDTRIGSLQFGESWDAMPGRYAQFVMEPGDIFSSGRLMDFMLYELCKPPSRALPIISPLICRRPCRLHHHHRQTRTPSSRISFGASRGRKRSSPPGSRIKTFTHLTKLNARECVSDAFGQLTVQIM